MRALGSLLIPLAISLITTPAAGQSTSINTEPGLVLKDLHGQQQSLNDYRGQIVVLNFWATWCLPCRQEMPALVSVQTRYGARGVRVIGTSVDDEQTLGEVPRVARSLKLNYPIWVGGTTDHMRALGLGNALPATAVVDRDGRVIGRIIGVVDEADLNQWMEWLLGDRRTPMPPLVINTIEKQSQDHKPHGDHGHHDDHGNEADHGHHGSHDHKSGDHDHTSIGKKGAPAVPN